jgi:hypothetical protein
MTYYKTFNTLTWFENDYVYLHSGKINECYYLLSFNAQSPINHNRKISSFSQAIIIYNSDVIKNTTLNEIDRIISTKKRELKINYLLNDI